MTETKICSKCKEEKPLSDFSSYFSKTKDKTVIYPSCKECKKQSTIKYRKANPEKVKAWQKERNKRRKESGYNKEYYQRTRDHQLERKRKYRKKNVDLLKEKSKQHYEENHEYYIERNARRRAAKLQRTPKWLTEEQKQEMKDFYKNCPEGHHVDHIMPLQGEIMSGLHVPWNLQYLPAKENIAKGNKIVNGGS